MRTAADMVAVLALDTRTDFRAFLTDDPEEIYVVKAMMREQSRRIKKQEQDAAAERARAKLNRAGG